MLLFEVLYDVLGRKPDPRMINEIASGGCAIGSALGLKRSQNEDRVLLYSGHHATGPFLLLSIADGMGGMEAGAECARLTLAMLVAELAANPLVDPLARIRAAVLAADRSVYDRFEGRGGATLSAVFVTRDGQVILVNVGDSRIYSIQQEKVELLTQDDTIEAHVARIENRPLSGENELISGRLLQFVGIGPGLDPHISSTPIPTTASFVITSDGAHRLSVDTFRDIATTATSPREVVARLLAVADWTGGHDNASVACLSSDTIKRFVSGKISRSHRGALWTPSNKIEIILNVDKLSPDVPHPDAKTCSSDASVRPGIPCLTGAREQPNVYPHKRQKRAAKKVDKSKNDQRKLAQPLLVPPDAPDLIEFLPNEDNVER